MIGQIGCLGKASLPKGLAASICYGIGVTSAAAFVGVLLGTFGSILWWTTSADRALGQSPAIMAAIGLAAFLGGILDSGALKIQLPTCHRQLTRHWFYVYGPYASSFLWGVQIGFAQRTRLPFAAVYVLAAWTVLMGSPIKGALAFATYGAVQGLMLMADVLGLAAGSNSHDGLLGRQRLAYTRPIGGTLMIACAVYVVISAVAIR